MKKIVNNNEKSCVFLFVCVGKKDEIWKKLCGSSIVKRDKYGCDVGDMNE